jgi:hypothetical protein
MNYRARWHWYSSSSVALSPRANYTDWATATCRRNLVPTSVDRRMSHGQRGRSPTVVNLSFLDRSRYFPSKLLLIYYVKLIFILIWREGSFWKCLLLLSSYAGELQPHATRTKSELHLSSPSETWYCTIRTVTAVVCWHRKSRISYDRVSQNVFYSFWLCSHVLRYWET